MTAKSGFLFLFFHEQASYRNYADIMGLNHRKQDQNSKVFFQAWAHVDHIALIYIESKVLFEEPSVDCAVEMCVLAAQRVLQNCKN